MTDANRRRPRGTTRSAPPLRVGPEPRIRRGTVRVTPDIAARLRAGHPLLFREALGARPLRESAGDPIEIVDHEGVFVARGLYDPDGVVAVRVMLLDPHQIIQVTAPLGTGLSPDSREGRRAVAVHARGRRVLNLFSYTGEFSVYAGRAGAKEVVSVDLAAKAHARARRNLTANGLDEHGHEFIA